MPLRPQPHDTTHMRLARGHRIELILLGMALSREGDRERILDEIDPEMLHSEIGCQILKSLKTKSTQDKSLAREGLRQWQIEPQEDGVIGAVIEKVKDDFQRRQFNAALNAARSTDDLSEAVSHVLDLIGE